MMPQGICAGELYGHDNTPHHYSHRAAPRWRRLVWPRALVLDCPANSGIKRSGNESFSMPNMSGDLKQPEAQLLALRIAATCPGRRASIAYIKDRIPYYIELTAADLKPSPKRPNEQMWQQLMGKVLLPRGMRDSVFTQGLALATEEGIEVTELGVEHLRRKGFII